MATKRKAARRAPSAPRNRAAAQGRRPDVILDVECEDGLLFLVLRNIGDDLACRIAVKFSPELVGLGGERVVSRAGVFQRLAYLSPGKSIRVFLDAAASLLARQPQNAFRARVSFRSRSGKSFSGTFAHDLDVFRDLPVAVRARGDGQGKT